MRVYHCDQGSPEWDALRCGIPTASMFKAVMREKGYGPHGTSLDRTKYLRRLAGEIVTGQPEGTYTNHHMERGTAMEEEARDAYALIHGVDLERVGFITNDAGSVGCSPDSLIGAAGMLEIKTAIPSVLIGHMERAEIPPEHKAQCQGNLWIAEREWIDVAIYWPAMPVVIRRELRDDDYIEKLASAVAAFNDDLFRLVNRIRQERGDVTAQDAFRASVLEAG